MKYHVCNRVKRSTETVSVHAKPYRVDNGERTRLTTANNQLVFCCSMPVKEYDTRKEAESDLKEHGKTSIYSYLWTQSSLIAAIENFVNILHRE